MGILNIFFGNKKEYIGLSSFKEQKAPIKKDVKEKIDKKMSEKTALTGILKRV